jgi:hypothetical protein
MGSVFGKQRVSKLYTVLKYNIKGSVPTSQNKAET